MSHAMNGSPVCHFVSHRPRMAVQKTLRERERERERDRDRDRETDRESDEVLPSNVRTDLALLD